MNTSSNEHFNNTVVLLWTIDSVIIVESVCHFGPSSSKFVRTILLSLGRVCIRIGKCKKRKKAVRNYGTICDLKQRNTTWSLFLMYECVLCVWTGHVCFIIMHQTQWVGLIRI